MRVSTTITATIAVLAVLLFIGGCVATGDGPLRSPDLNFEISNMLQTLYFDHVVAQDDISVKYGSFNANSYAPNGVLDFAKLQQLTVDFISLFATIGTAEVEYLDSGLPGPIFNMTGPTDVGTVLGQALVFGKVYAQYHIIGGMTVEQIGDDLYRVG